MRDALIERISSRMDSDDSLFFLTADLGAPSFDSLKSRHPKRCINVGIAEQNLINIATGLALEGFTVYAYGIAPFVSMRSCEQLRNLALLAQSRELNVNVVSLGAGFSYDVSGPTHHCIEDLSLVRLLPNIELFSPCDSFIAGDFFDFTLREKRPKYLRLDGKILPPVYDAARPDFSRGFSALRQGGSACLVTTGYATQKGLRIVGRLKEQGVEAGLIDLYLLKGYDEDALASALSGYESIFTVEESLTGRGGLDSLIANLICDRYLPLRLKRYGPSGSYLFANGGRESLHKSYGMDDETIIRDIMARR
jgi:transketolase